MSMSMDIKVSLIGKVDLDSAGISGILSGPEVTGMVNSTANRIAAGARALIPSGSHFNKTPGAEIVVQPYVAKGGKLIGTRSAASVVVRYPKAAGLQARYGILTKPVAALGLSVSRRRAS